MSIIVLFVQYYYCNITNIYTGTNPRWPDGQLLTVLGISGDRGAAEEEEEEEEKTQKEEKHHEETQKEKRHYEETQEEGRVITSVIV